MEYYFVYICELLTCLESEFQRQKYMIPSSRTLPSNWKENKEVSKIYKKDAMITAKKGIFNQVFSKARAP